MGLMSFLHFSFDYCVNFLALPLLALVYPLCASIRAIENNSFADSQTLNAYWVVLSLMLLLEHGFMKLFGWSPSWQYIRIAIVCLFVIPYFEGALYVYKCFIRLLLFVNTQIFINRFKTHKESLLARENFLDELDRYVKENGTEAVKKILSKSYSREPDVSHVNIKSLEVTEKKEVMAMDQDQSYLREPNVSHEDIKSLEVTEMKEVMTMDQDQSCSRKPDVSHEDIKSLEVTEKKEVMTMDQDQSSSRELDVSHEDIKSLEVTEKKEVITMDQDQSSSREPDVSHEDIKSLEVTEKKEVMTMDQDQSSSREPNVSHEDIKSLEVTKKKEVMTMDQDQVCQVERHFTWTSVSWDASHETPQRETNSSDIRKAENETMPTRENVQVQLNSVSGSSATKSKENTVETAKAPLSSGKKQKPSTKGKEKIEKQNKKVPNTQTVEMNAAPIWCHVCKISCTSVITMESHLKGRKHMARIRSTTAV